MPTNRDYVKAYSKTEKYKISRARYLKSAKGKAMTRKKKAKYERVHGHKLWLRKRYGITPAEYSAILEAQGGHCAACPEAENGGKRLYVDHDHETGAVRGLLCQKCNSALGLLGDSEYRLMQLLDYKMQH